jgi:putative addiction module component (TIGR02574 family)
MTDRVQALVRKAMALPADERANVAAELLASLDDSVPEDPVAVQAAWAKEIEKRARRVLAGESSGQPWDDVRDRVRRRLTHR